MQTVPPFLPLFLQKIGEDKLKRVLDFICELSERKSFEHLLPSEEQGPWDLDQGEKKRLDDCQQNINQRLQGMERHHEELKVKHIPVSYTVIDVSIDLYYWLCRYSQAQKCLLYAIPVNCYEISKISYSIKFSTSYVTN